MHQKIVLLVLNLFRMYWNIFWYSMHVLYSRCKSVQYMYIEKRGKNDIDFIDPISIHFNTTDPQFFGHKSQIKRWSAQNEISDLIVLSQYPPVTRLKRPQVKVFYSFQDELKHIKSNCWTCGVKILTFWFWIRTCQMKLGSWQVNR